MSTPLMVAAAIAALAFFWMLGAHNRLVGLRNQILAAWGKVQDTLTQRTAALQPMVAALREPLPPPPRRRVRPARHSPPPPAA